MNDFGPIFSSILPNFWRILFFEGFWKITEDLRRLANLLKKFTIIYLAIEGWWDGWIGRTVKMGIRGGGEIEWGNEMMNLLFLLTFRWEGWSDEWIPSFNLCNFCPDKTASECLLEFIWRIIINYFVFVFIQLLRKRILHHFLAE